MKTMKAIMVFMLLITSAAQAAVNGLFFRLEVELKTRPNIDDFTDFQPSEGNMDKGSKILAGKYNDYLIAMKAKYTYAKLSANPAAIVAFFNEERVSLDEAFAIINDENNTDKIVINRPDSTETNKTVAALRTDIKFRFEFYADENHTLAMMLEKHPEWSGSVATCDGNKYLLGNYQSHQEALLIQNQLDREGFKRNVIVAYQHDQKIPVLVALGYDPKPLIPVVAQGK